MKKNIIDIAQAVDFDKIKLPNWVTGKVGDTDPNNDPTKFDLGRVSALVADFTKIAFDIIIIIGVLFILYSSFLYVTSYGDESKVETAKKTLLWSIVGTIVAFLANALVDVINTMLAKPL